MGENFTAFLLGQMVRRSMGAAKTPVAYLYNGVRLPELPDSELPYAMIQRRSADSNTVSLTLTKNKLYDTGDKAYFQGISPWEIYRCNVGDSNWEQSSSRGEGYSSAFLLQTIMWTNYDILKSDGSMVFSASTPIPVYE